MVVRGIIVGKGGENVFRIPSFDDFLATIGEERSSEWFMSVHGMKLCDSPPVTPGDYQQFASTVLAASYEITAAMMRDYHEWLVQQLSSKSIHLVK